MVLNRNNFPSIGELVVCKVTNVQRGYIQVLLEDYRGLPHEEHASGMVHISELSNRWVKNITSILDIGQRAVLTVLRVNEERGYLDLSLRRVNKVARVTTMNEWRYRKKLEGLLNFFAESHNITLEELYDKAIFAITEKYGDLHTAFEEVKEEGFEELDKIEGIDLTPEIKNDLYNFIIDNVTISKIEITIEYDIRSQAGNGIELIKEAFSEAEKIRKPKGVELKFSYIGAPIYRCEIEAKDYPTAEKVLGKITEKIESIIGSNGQVEMIRDQLSNSQEA